MENYVMLDGKTKMKPIKMTQFDGVQQSGIAKINYNFSPNKKALTA